MAGITIGGYVHPRAQREGSIDDYLLDVTEDPASRYVEWIVELCSPHLGPTVLDVGAGRGAITRHIQEGRRVTALERSAPSAEFLESRFAAAPNVRVVHGDQSALDGARYDSILLTNVLEHIREDSVFLAELSQHLVRHGNIVIYVPAINHLFTNWDRNAGHYRRYSKSRLAGVVEEAGLRSVELRYVNALAIPAWPLSGRLVGREGELARSVGIWDRLMVPTTRFIESRVRLPIGLNLLCVAEAG